MTLNAGCQYEVHKDIEDKIKDDYREKNILFVDINYVTFSASKSNKTRRKSDCGDKEKVKLNLFLEDYMKKACCLRNSNGGVLVVHVQGKMKEDVYLGDFYEKVDDLLSGLIEDDTMFVHNFGRRVWLDGSNKEYFVSLVSGSPSISTVHFRTIVSLDKGREKPKARQLAKFYEFPPDETQQDFQPRTERQEKNFDFREDQELCDVRLLEARDTELKSFVNERDLKDDEKNLSHPERPSILVKHFWVNLKVQEYITAFAKMDGGGSLFCGIEEVCVDGKKSGISKVTGIELTDIQKGNLEKQLKDKIVKSMKWCQRNETNNSKPFPENNIKIKFHKISSKSQTPHQLVSSLTVPDDVSESRKYVVEIAVLKRFDGIAFTHEDGPLSFRLDKNNIVQVEYKHWLERILKLAKCKKCHSVID